MPIFYWRRFSSIVMFSKIVSCLYLCVLPYLQALCLWIYNKILTFYIWKLWHLFCTVFLCSSSLSNYLNNVSVFVNVFNIIVLQQSKLIDAILIFQIVMNVDYSIVRLIYYYLHSLYIRLVSIVLAYKIKHLHFMYLGMLYNPLRACCSIFKAILHTA